MNVTKENFTTALAELASVLPTAAFVAIDEEMTGIHMPGVFVERLNDTTGERYEKMKTVAEHYRLIQIGLAVFHADPDATAEEPKFTARTYNVYLFPEDGAVNMEASAIHFNRSHGMNFNKWIYEGVPYVTEEGEQRMREKFYGTTGEGWEREQARVSGMVVDSTPPTSSVAASPSGEDESGKKKKKSITLERESDIAYINLAKGQIKSWLAGRKPDEHELLLPECNSFLRLALRQAIEALPDNDELFGTTARANVSLETRPIPGQGRYKQNFVVCHYTPEERKTIDEAAAVKKRADFDAKLGFRLVWQLLKQARRPIVTHNGFYDLLFMWSHFESAKLPATLPEFKKALAEKFPAGLYDTKYLAAHRQFTYPFEHLARLAVKVGHHSDDVRRRLAKFAELAVPTADLTVCRFRETHLEKLYLVLKAEDETRKLQANGTNAKADVKLDATAAAASTSASPSPPAVSAPPPYGGVTIQLAPGHDKYALIGTPEGDASAAHEAGYDAFMTAVIFAHFAAEAPHEELMDALTGDAVSPWRNRIPLYRHLMALNLNCSAETGEPIEDSLIDESSSIYMLSGFPSEWKNEDISALFEGKYTSAKRKLEENGSTASSSDAMVDVGESGTSTVTPSAVTITAPPRIIWIDESSVFLSIPKSDTAKMDVFVATHFKAMKEDATTTTTVPAELTLVKYAQPATL